MANKNEVVEQKTPMDMAINSKFIDSLSAQIEKKKECGLSFPANYSVGNALNSAYLIIQELTISKKVGNNWVQERVLDQVTQQSVASCLLDMTTQALNPMKKQCYFIKYGNKLTLRRSYQGTMAVAKRCGVTKTPIAQCIYKGDEFSYHIENGRKVFDKHIQNFENIDLENIIGAYAILETEDGMYLEIMNMKQIKESWKKGEGYKKELEKNEGVHFEFADQMAMKTVISRACKNFINSSDDADLIDTFNETTENDELDVVSENVRVEIDTKANTEVFEEADFTEVEENVVESKVIESTEAEIAGDDTPDFMK